MKRLRRAFVTGVLALVPLIVTIDILLWFVRAVDGTFRNYLPTTILPFDFRGLGLILSLIIILSAGVLTQSYFGKAMMRFFDTAIKKVPLGGGIYAAIKKFLETIFNPQSDQFKGAVLVPFPRAGVYSIGFHTGLPDPKIARKLQGQFVNIFVPCAPNPTSGFYLLVAAEEVIPLDLSVQEAFKIAISMGIVTSEEKKA